MTAINESRKLLAVLPSTPVPSAVSLLMWWDGT